MEIVGSAGASTCSPSIVETGEASRDEVELLVVGGTLRMLLDHLIDPAARASG